VYTFSGYFFGSFPPGKFFATRIAGLVVKHMLIAHERAYELIKKLPGALAGYLEAEVKGSVLCSFIGLSTLRHALVHTWLPCFTTGGMDSEVGLVHNEMRFEIFQGDRISKYAPHCRILVPIFDKCWGNEVSTAGRRVYQPCSVLAAALGCCGNMSLHQHLGAL
jgi:hypothetical protein